MGNQQAKKGEQLPFTNEELKILENSFRQTSGGHTEKLTENKLLVSECTTQTGLVIRSLERIPKETQGQQIPILFVSFKVRKENKYLKVGWFSTKNQPASQDSQPKVIRHVWNS